MIKHKDHSTAVTWKLLRNVIILRRRISSVSVQMSIRWEFLISYVPPWPIIWMRSLRILTGSIQLFAPVLPRMRERSRKM